MRIGIDIDDTITNTQDKIDEYALNNGYTIYDRTKHWFNERFDTSKDEYATFLTNYVVGIFENVSIKESASEYINKLIDEGNEIYIITARSDHYDVNVPNITIKYLEDKGIKYNKIIFACRDKARICLDNKIDILVDDSIENITNVEEVGIKTIIIDNEYNQDVETTRAHNWEEVYNIITGR